MFKGIFSLFFLLCTSCSFLENSQKDTNRSSIIENAECIFEVYDFPSISKIIDKLQGNVLVVFDNNDVITVPDFKILQSFYKKNLKEKIKLLENRKISDDKYRDLMSWVFLLSDNNLLDDNAPLFFKSLQNKKNRKVMLCSNCFVGKYGLIDKYEDLVYKKLLHTGIDFKKGWEKYKKHTFKNFLKKGSSTFKSNKNHPIFYNGMLLVSSNDKGIVLKEFLSYYKLKPDVLVFVDDKCVNLESVKKAMDDINVKTVLIKYVKK